MEKIYDFTGADFTGFWEDIHSHFEGCIGFSLAMGEAVCNAMRYSPKGYEDAVIKVVLRKNDRHIIAQVISDSEGFDVKSKLANLPKLEEMKKATRGRGLPMMFKLCDRVKFNAAGNTVIIAANIAKQKEI